MNEYFSLLHKMIQKNKEANEKKKKMMKMVKTGYGLTV